MLKDTIFVQEVTIICFVTAETLLGTSFPIIHAWFISSVMKLLLTLKV